jgi:hypothetical protein
MTTKTATQTPAPSAAAQLATAEFDNVVPKMLGSIKLGKVIGYGLMTVVLAATFPHVGLYLYHLIGALGWVFPAIFGGGLLAFYHVAQTPGLTRDGRRASYLVVGLCGAAELAVQIVASPDWGTRALFVSAVVIGLAAKYAAARIKADLPAIAAAETAAAAQAAQLAPAPLTPAQKGAITRANKAAAAKTAAKTPAQRTRKTPSNAAAITNGTLPAAPVSPAPWSNGQTDTGLWIARTAAEATAKI